MYIAYDCRTQMYYNIFDYIMIFTEDTGFFLLVVLAVTFSFTINFFNYVQLFNKDSTLLHGHLFRKHFKILKVGVKEEKSLLL